MQWDLLVLPTLDIQDIMAEWELKEILALWAQEASTAPA
jgi:hypothetical protein